MSHLEEREEKVCLNCNAQLYGRYCHICGQENLAPKESFWHLLTHFVYDLTHFDGKFFNTLKYLLVKPGFLAIEYQRGRRASYLHPIRMYVFASAIFFVVFFSFIVKPEEIGEAVAKNSKQGFSETKQTLQDSINITMDSTKKSGFIEAYKAINNLNTANNNSQKDSTGKTKGAYRNKEAGETAQKNIAVKPAKDSENQKADKDSEESFTANAAGLKFKATKELLPPTIAKYDSLQKLLPEKKRDGWFNRFVKKRAIEIENKYHGNNGELFKTVIEKLAHSVPQMMFVSLPLVALLLQLLYVRRRKQYYYVNHVIFIIYVYIATFVSLLVWYSLAALATATKFAPIHWLQNTVVAYMLFYCLLAMHNFYKQGYVKSFFKYFLLLFMCLFLWVFIGAIYFFTSLISA